MIWTGLGVNYGHSLSVFTYNGALVDAELTLLKKLGITKIRVGNPTFSFPGDIAMYQDVISRALAQGFYVVWGVVSGDQGSVSATTWASFKSYITSTLAPYAQALNNSNFELSLGNEEELACDGATLTAATVRSDIKALATTVKGIYTIGKISYHPDASQIAAWNSLGIGLLDFIAFHPYDTLSNFQFIVTTAVAAFGNKTYFSEWGPQDQFNNLGLSEDDYAIVVANRLAILKNSGVLSAYYYEYDNTNSWSWQLKLVNGNYRVAFPSLIGQRAWFFANPNLSVSSQRSLITRSSMNNRSLISRSLF